MKGDPELYKSCAVITDGRVSGGTSGLSVGYVSPEAALGGPLGLIKEGDIITIDVAKRTMNVELSEEELADIRDASVDYENGVYSRAEKITVGFLPCTSSNNSL